MSKSLIRKNQLHPDIADLVSGYGNDLFITPVELAQALLGLEAGLPLDGIVYTTGNQTIEGDKNFLNRPKVNGVNVLLQGETINDQNIVFTTGTQTITGPKNFTARPTFNGVNLATIGEVGGGSTVFTGNRPITANVIGFKDQIPGGNDVVTFLNNVFYPFTQAIIGLNSFPLQELGTSISSINYTGTINPGSLNFGTDINNLTPFANNVARTPIISTPSTSYNTNVNIGGPFTNNISNCFVRINTKNQVGNVITLDSVPLSILFEAPMYAGSGLLNLMTLTPSNTSFNIRNVLSGQTNSITNNGKALISKPSSRVITVTTNGYYYFVYPDSWNLLSRIEDINFNLNFLSDFTSGTIQLPLVNGTNHLYRWYRNINQITLSNYGVRYIF